MALLSDFVTVVGDGESYYSSGMKSFGLPDVRIPYNISAIVAEDILNHFNSYQLAEKPVFAHRELFTVDQYPLRFWIEHKMDDRTDVQADMYNPFGVLDLLLV